MKKLNWLGLCLLILSGSVLAKEYKCYVELDDADSRISFVRLANTATQQDAKQSLLLNGVFAANGIDKIQVLKVGECVLSRHKFSSQQARDAEKNTPY